MNNGHWFLPSMWHTARVGSDDSGTAHTGFIGVRALPCGLDYVLFPLRLFGGDGFSDVLTAYGPSSLAATFLVSSPEEYSYAEFSGRPFRKRSRIQRYLVRQWLHVCVSSRGAWFDGAVTAVVPQLHFIEGRRLPFRGAEAVSHGLACLEDHGDSAVAVCFLVVAALFCRSCLLCPLLFSTGAHGPDSAEIRGGSAVAVPSWLWTSL